MKHILKQNAVSLLLALLLSSASLLASCADPQTPASPDPTGTAESTTTAQPEETTSDPETAPDKPLEPVDLVATVKLDMHSETLKQEVTVKAFIDGDTTHFHVPDTIEPSGVLKARYLAINTPESTGKIEEWGKAASRFTRDKLEHASSILIESDTAEWNRDSTGGRILVWVWYKPDASSEYRNLNIEILQNGLAIASNSANNRYGNTCLSALNQAKQLKLNLFSGVKDPDFYYGDAIELTLKELRCHIEDYNGKKVAFTGVITKNNNNSVYMEDYDPDTGLYFGMTVYYGFNLSGDGLDILRIGNRSRIVGTVQYYELGDSYQISGLTYRAMKPNDPNNIQKISDGHDPAYAPVTADQLNGEKITVSLGETEKTFDYAYLSLYASVEMKGLHVKKIYTTADEGSASKGAMTLTCETADGKTVTVRTVVLRDTDGNLITSDAFLNKTVDVRGIIDSFHGEYQIKVFSVKDITEVP